MFAKKQNDSWIRAHMQKQHVQYYATGILGMVMIGVYVKFFKKDVSAQSTEGDRESKSSEQDIFDADSEYTQDDTRDQRTMSTTKDRSVYALDDISLERPRRIIQQDNIPALQEYFDEIIGANMFETRLTIDFPPNHPNARPALTTNQDFSAYLKQYINWEICLEKIKKEKEVARSEKNVSLYTIIKHLKALNSIWLYTPGSDEDNKTIYSIKKNDRLKDKFIRSDLILLDVISSEMLKSNQNDKDNIYDLFIYSIIVGVLCKHVITHTVKLYAQLQLGYDFSNFRTLQQALLEHLDQIIPDCIKPVNIQDRYLTPLLDGSRSV